MKNTTVIYVITSLGAETLQLPINTTFRTHEKNYVNSKFWEPSSLFTIIEEKSDRLDSHKIIKRNTRWIATESKNPIINTINGPYINKGCHIMPSYQPKFLQS